MRMISTVVSIGLLAACGGPSGKVENEDGMIEYDVDAGGDDTEIRFTDNDGNEAVVRSGTDVAVDLPDGFSVYPGAEIVSNTTMSGADEVGTMIVMNSSDKPARLVEHYRRQAEAAGIAIEMEMISDGTAMIAGEMSGGRSFSFTTTPNGDGTTGTLMIGAGRAN